MKHFYCEKFGNSSVLKIKESDIPVHFYFEKIDNIIIYKNKKNAKLRNLKKMKY